MVLAAKPLGGGLSDRVGRRRRIITLTVLTISLVYLALDLMLLGPRLT